MAKINLLSIFKAIFVVIPLLFLPISYGFEIPKVIAVEFMIEVSLVFFILNTQYKNLDKRFLGILVVLFLITVLDLLFLRTSISFYGNAARHQGLFLIWHVMCFALIVSAYKNTKINSPIPFISLILLFISSLFFSHPHTERAIGTLGESNALAATALIYLVLILKSTYKPLNTILIKVIAVIVTVIIIFLSGSRSALVGFGIISIYLLFAHLFQLKRSLILILCIGLYLFSLSLPFISHSESWENRGAIWRTAVTAGLGKPITGHGFGNTEIALSAAAKKINSPLQYEYVDSSHNIFLDFFVQGGLVAFGLLVFLVLRAFYIFYTRNNNYETSCLLGVITVLSFNPASVVILIALWWLIGLSWHKETV